MPDNNHPPKWILAFFRWFCRVEYQEDLEGDLLERFEKRRQGSGLRHARIKLMQDVLRLVRPGLIRSFVQMPEINFYGIHFRIAWRTLIKNKSFAALNIAGLTLGVTCCLLIFSFVKFHKGYDSYHEASDRIYRFVTEQHRDNISYTPGITNPFGKVFRQEFDKAENVARACTQEILITTAADTKYQETVVFVEDDYFKIFNLPWLKGNLESALENPGSVILTESLAKKYFGDSDAVGETIKLNNNILATVTGILQDIPPNSDFRTQLYISFNTLPQHNEWYSSENSWGGLSDNMQCFVRLRPGVTPQAVEEAVAPYPARFRPGSTNRHVYKLQPLRDVHFSLRYGGVVSERNLNVLLAIGFVLLITACFNFINLATALNVQRIKEVGITKSLGGTRKNLFWRFITETSIITSIAFAISLGLSWYAVDYINPWLGDRLHFDYSVDLKFLIYFPLLLLFVIFLSGSYPGLRMARLSPIEALAGRISGRRDYTLRRTLIVAQFSISQLLTIGMIIMVVQMKYAEGDLGFARDSIVMVPLGSQDEKAKSLKNEILGLRGVDRVSACFASPASTENRWGSTVWYDNRQEAEVFNIEFKGGDADYLETFELELLAGQNLAPDDSIRGFLVNETFLAKMNIRDPQEVLGKQLAINRGEMSAPIVGVVRDFYDRSFHQERNAVCITTSLEHYSTYAIRLSVQNFQEVLANIQSQWSQQYPEQLFQYEFLDDQLAQFYETDRVLIHIIKAFSFIAIFIGSLGLLGMISFMAANRKKEIAIRKVLGSSAVSIVSIFSSEFLKLVAIASFIAVPIGWWMMSKWLEGFVYRISPQPWVFAVAIGATMFLSAIAISVVSFKAAVANPVDSLRSDG